jgi:diguanylate cyclase (GGDEF)-like protein
MREYLPRGQLLPEDAWRRRHRTLSILLRMHVAGLFVFALVRGFGLMHAVNESAIILLFAVLAWAGQHHRRFSSAMCALGLMTSSAVLVHLSGGTIEAHFHFFVMVGIMTLYQDWLPFLVAIGYVVVHHGVMGTLRPEEVYNHQAAVAHPLRWAVIHGTFVLAASVASIIAWKLNEEQSLRDSLTRLPNRKLFQDRLDHAIARSQRQPGLIAVLVIDLDDFKNVNDTMGHAAGDQLLTIVAERLRACLRPADTAARLGGDEFAVLLEDLKKEEDASRVANRVLDGLAVAVALRGKEVAVHASVGIAVGRRDLSAGELLRNADVAMYTAKRETKGSFALFEASMHTAVVDRLSLESDLQHALERDELVVHFQPLVHLDTGRLAGVEALVRWNHPERGLLPPLEFIEVAERTGFIIPMGAWVLEHACAQTQAWREQYPDQPFGVSVNLSPRQLQQSDVVDMVRGALERTGLEAGALTLELTEGVLMFDSEQTEAQLHALKALGVQLAIDDFGTGYSSLGHLRRLPFDILKIDKLFIDGIGGGPAESAFARAIMKLARTLDLETVAEGIEGANQASELRDLHCDLGQGYYFAKPLPAQDIDALLGSTAGAGWAQSTAELSQ